MENLFIETQKETGLQEFLKLRQSQNKYKLTVSPFLETKIRYLCDKFPTREWSGIMFYDVIGKFEDETLEIICKDFCLMDVGSGGWTEYNINSEVAQYMAMNDLMDYKQGIIHSHNSMAAFFSGTDINTLEQEGSKRDIFVSLIVNNKGKYTAAITNQIDREIKQDITDTYKGFGDTFSQKSNETITNKYVEYCIFKEIVVEKAEELPEDILDELNERISVLETRRPVIEHRNIAYYNGDDDFDDTYKFLARRHEGYLWEDMEAVARVERGSIALSDEQTIDLVAYELLGKIIGGKIYTSYAIENINTTHITKLIKLFNYDIKAFRFFIDETIAYLLTDSVIELTCERIKIAYNKQIDSGCYANRILNSIDDFLINYKKAKSVKTEKIKQDEDFRNDYIVGFTETLADIIESYT